MANESLKSFLKNVRRYQSQLKSALLLLLIFVAVGALSFTVWRRNHIQNVNQPAVVKITSADLVAASEITPLPSPLPTVKPTYKKVSYTRQVVKKVPVKKASGKYVSKKVVKVVKATKMVRVVEPAAAPVRKIIATHTVKKGDSLWKISKQQYGHGKTWPAIYNVNKKVIGKNPNKIYPGQTFSIPRQARYNRAQRVMPRLTHKS